MPHLDLLELPYFAGISIDDLVALIDRMRPVSFKRDEVIVAEGSRATPLHIATVGQVAITKQSPDGTSVTLAEITAPTLFGEIELFCRMPAVASARALSAVQAFQLDAAQLETLLAEHHPATTRFTFNVARVACHRLAVADEILARKLPGEDLVALRRLVFASMAQRNGWSRTTGIFTRE